MYQRYEWKGLLTIRYEINEGVGELLGRCDFCEEEDFLKNLIYMCHVKDIYYFSRFCNDSCANLWLLKKANKR